jgi:hypothetical protein
MRIALPARSRTPLAEAMRTEDGIGAAVRLVQAATG